MYRWPTLPFGILSIFGVDPSVNDDGREKVYSLDIPRQAVNAGVVIERPALRLDAGITAQLSSNAPIHPWFLSSLDENDVQGYAGIPVNSNGLMPDFLRNVGAAGGVFLPPGRYYVSVDSGRDFFTGRSLAGPYRLRSWVNDVRPPNIALITRRISAGRPTIVARVRDAASGVDPLSMLLLFGQDFQLGATAYDPDTGIAVFPIPREANALQRGAGVHADLRVRLPGDEEHPDRGRQPDAELAVPRHPHGGRGAADDHLDPPEQERLPSGAGEAPGRRGLERDDLVGRVLRRQAPDRAHPAERRRHLRDHVADARQARGTHTLTAVVSDTRGREAEATLQVRVCR